MKLNTIFVGWKIHYRKTDPKVNCSFNILPIKIPTGFFMETEKLILEFIRKSKGPRIAKTFAAGAGAGVGGGGLLNQVSDYL